MEMIFASAAAILAAFFSVPVSETAVAASTIAESLARPYANLTSSLMTLSTSWAYPAPC